MLTSAILIIAALFFLLIALMVALVDAKEQLKAEERISDFWVKASDKWKHEAVKRGCPSGECPGHWDGN